MYDFGIDKNGNTLFMDEKVVLFGKGLVAFAGSRNTDNGLLNYVFVPISDNGVRFEACAPESLAKQTIEIDPYGVFMET